MSVKKLAIVMPARGNVRWTLEAIESVWAQERAEGWSYHLLVGVDDCEETVGRLSVHPKMFGFARTYRCVGPHVIRNSLIQEALGVSVRNGSYSAFATFDSDDIMLPGYLAGLVTYLDRFGGIVGADRININEHGLPSGDGSERGLQYAWECGVCMFTRAAWERLGGYRDWRSGADRDWIVRARAAGIPITRKPVALYRRRLWEGSVSSLARASGEKDRLRKLSADGVVGGQLRIEPIVTPLEWLRGGAL